MLLIQKINSTLSRWSRVWYGLAILSLSLAVWPANAAPRNTIANAVITDRDRIQAPTSLVFDRLFLFYEDPEATESPWWQSNTVVDATGGAHTTFFTNQSIYYAYCPAGCGDPGNWSMTPLASSGIYDSLSHPVLAIDPFGHPRLMRYKEPNYTYAECDANCTQPGNWTEIEVPLGPGLFSIYPSNVRYFALDTQGRPRFVAPYYLGLVYAACDANCTSLEHWQYALLDIGEGLDHLQLTFNISDQPRLAAINGNDELDYIQCNADCMQAAQWSPVTVATGIGWLMGYPNFSLRVDSQGRPRIAFYKAYEDDVMHYAWSDVNFTNPTSWSSYEMPLPPADSRTLDLAIDSLDRPHIAFASDELNLRYLECTALCETQDAQWTIYDVESGEDLDLSNPIPPDPGCLVAIWMLDGYPSLALDADDNVNISYHANHAEYCNRAIYYNASGIRFAYAGGGIPSQEAHKVFLPLLKR